MKRRDFIRSLVVLGAGAGVAQCTRDAESHPPTHQVVVRAHPTVTGTNEVVSSADQQASLAGVRMMMKRR